MTVQHSGGGQPARTLALLWRHHRPLATGGEPAKPALGRKPTLNLDAVVDAAIRLADAEGLAAASMTRVAKALGVGTMTLYTYVPSKEELLDLMVDQVLGERELPGPGEPRPADWREQVEVYSEHTRAMFRRHRWLAQISTIRPPVGPGMLAGREYLLSALSALSSTSTDSNSNTGSGRGSGTVNGLAPPQINAGALAITTYVDSAASLEAESEQLEQVTGQSNDAWWNERNELWETYFDVERHPTMTEIWHTGGFGHGTRQAAADSYRFGLDRLLDGIHTLAAQGRPAVDPGGLGHPAPTSGSGRSDSDVE
jgi:AcrR family transcriptional regulator